MKPQNKKSGRLPGTALPARMPIGYVLPDVKIDFASDTILGALKRAGMQHRPVALDTAAKPADSTSLKKNKEKGHEARVSAQALMKRRAFDRILWRELMQRKNIDDEISWAVSHYISSTKFAISPKDFRQSLKAFNLALQNGGADAIERPLPFVDAAIKRELRQKGDDAQDFDYSEGRANRKKASDITSSIIVNETGRGTDGNRAAHKLIADLAGIFNRHTGGPVTRGNGLSAAESKKPTKDESQIDINRTSLASPFGRFVDAVNELIPPDFRLPNIDNLIKQFPGRKKHPKRGRPRKQVIQVDRF